ncbi:MAG: ribosome maturation factor RimM [Inconstantimicrobium porci]|uniref:Ribosome maturation factor RimM n=1 Tax=Inconstantimicrobium porci TaxID=2652291 RepID=A0A7X2T0S3_9CLOT|nr:ribosome maturation factor RimM [Inconstantimicrobium porci]MDD6772106.1 ribosome maturation factor RimM [Inconstantimicrobium porci]MDY5911269.1 ribosome maturation factor RimM [Inconstantimicrobium porci]MSR90138.1 16S rRNA processing protein RimM [Inconstantimicrobium porci]
MKKEIFNIGKIVNTHGVRGEVKVLPLTDDMKRFDDLNEVSIGGKNYIIENRKYQKDRVILKLEGIDSIEETAKIRNKYIEIERKDVVELPDDTYFISDIIGCRVIDTDEFEYGKVFDVIQTKNNDVYWVKGKKEILIPVLKEIVTDINVDEGVITIRPSGEWQDED